MSIGWFCREKRWELRRLYTNVAKTTVAEGDASVLLRRTRVPKYPQSHVPRLRTKQELRRDNSAKIAIKFVEYKAYM
jgi:hypothetical protein